MAMSKNLIIGVVIAALILIGGFVAYKSMNNKQPGVSGSDSNAPAVDQAASPSMDTSSPATDSAMTDKKAIFTLSSSGVSPASVTIKAGDTVTWVNNTGSNISINSAPHPQHTDYPPLNIGIIENGGQKSLNFPTAGTYKWHNHLNPSQFGSITVQ